MDCLAVVLQAETIEASLSTDNKVTILKCRIKTI